MKSIESLIQTVIKGQSASGAFQSTVYIAGRPEPDWNGFTSALTVRTLASAPASQALGEAREKALDFLESCESPERRGAFGFWPRRARPAWGIGMVEDADDTAVIALELFRNGRLTVQDIRRIVIKVLLSHRVTVLPDDVQPWVRTGAFLTWLNAGICENPIDCCVNANVVALMAAAGLTHLDAYSEACAVIEDGIRWADRSWSGIRSLTPYYPDPFELVLAVTHAFESGALACASALELLNKYPEYQAPVQKKIFSSLDGNVFWISEPLAAARQLSRLERKGGWNED